MSRRERVQTKAPGDRNVVRDERGRGQETGRQPYQPTRDGHARHARGPGLDAARAALPSRDQRRSAVGVVRPPTATGSP
jgi:hypothetical protein